MTHFFLGFKTVSSGLFIIRTATLVGRLAFTFADTPIEVENECKQLHHQAVMEGKRKESEMN